MPNSGGLRQSFPGVRERELAAIKLLAIGPSGAGSKNLGGPRPLFQKTGGKYGFFADLPQILSN
jgi:hypothetical protein